MLVPSWPRGAAASVSASVASPLRGSRLKRQPRRWTGATHLPLAAVVPCLCVQRARRSGSKVSKRCSAAVAAKPVEQAKEVAQRKLLAEVEVLEVIQHPRKPELALVEVTDPDFPEGPPLPVAAEAERWKVGDKAALMQVGSQVPKAAPVQGLLRQLAGAALARSRGAMEGPLDLAKLPSVGLLFPVGACEEPQPLEAFQSRVALEVRGPNPPRHVGYVVR
ncbi:unnamed protein product [Effrenium voratum]|uniref:Uncharacterized protein n=1 Tax=Effrenium voratum TaxID=2562239 RepID=A0AA36I6P8_9DINO|nr:unnamed protein product [Effrenium voratum]